MLTGRKRKATAQYGGPSKKPNIDESLISVSRGPDCPIIMGGNTTTHNNCVYFSDDGIIFEFDLTSRNWTKYIECPQVVCGLATIENELVVVGGLLPTEDESQVATNKVICFPLEKNKGKRKSTRHKKEEKKEWKEKYPVMKQKRVYPEVLVFGNYLIVLGGYITHDAELKPIISVEVLDTKSKCWYSNERMSLPPEFSSMKWLSACICGKDLYIAAKHDDPQFKDSLCSKIGKDMEEDPDEINYQGGEEINVFDYYFLDGPCPCYSMYRCCVDTLLHVAQESDDVATNQMEKTILWQKLQHPHYSVYDNFDQREDEGMFLYYGVCHFTLSHINNELYAVGCQHIDSISNESLVNILDIAYRSYNTDIQWCKRASLQGITARKDEETIDYECHIYHYDVDDDSWDLVKSTPHNGDSSKKPSVAVVDKELVIVRHSKTVHIVTFP